MSRKQPSAGRAHRAAAGALVAALCLGTLGPALAVVPALAAEGDAAQSKQAEAVETGLAPQETTEGEQGAVEEGQPDPSFIGTSNASSIRSEATVLDDSMESWAAWLGQFDGAVALSMSPVQLSDAQQATLEADLGTTGQEFLGAFDIAVDEYLSDGSDGHLQTAQHDFGPEDGIRMSLRFNLFDTGLGLADASDYVVVRLNDDGSVDRSNSPSASSYDPSSQYTTVSDFTATGTYAIVRYQDVPEPWDESGKLLPYEVSNGVMTFPGHPELGEWYQLTVKADDGIVASVPGGGGTSAWTMTIDAAALDPADPLYSETADSGVYFVRGNALGGSTGLFVDYDHTKSYDFRLTPGTGTAVASTLNPIININLTAPSTIEVWLSDSFVSAANEQGASFTHEGADFPWRMLTLVTDQLGGDVAQAATDAVVAAVDGVTGHPYVFDIHLANTDGSVFTIPEGEKVTVTLPIPKGLSAEGLRVFHVANDGTVTDMNAVVDAEAGTVSFETTHFSTFVLANVKVAGPTTPPTTTAPSTENEGGGLPKTGDASVATLALGALAAAGAGLVAISRRTR